MNRTKRTKRTQPNNLSGGMLNKLGFGPGEGTALKDYESGIPTLRRFPPNMAEGYFGVLEMDRESAGLLARAAEGAMSTVGLKSDIRYYILPAAGGFYVAKEARKFSNTAKEARHIEELYHQAITTPAGDDGREDDLIARASSYTQFTDKDSITVEGTGSKKLTIKGYYLMMPPSGSPMLSHAEQQVKAYNFKIPLEARRIKALINHYNSLLGQAMTDDDKRILTDNVDLLPQGLKDEAAEAAASAAAAAAGPARGPPDGRPARLSAQRPGWSGARQLVQQVHVPGRRVRVAGL